MSTYFIIGMGAAGMEAAAAIRRHDPDARVTVAGDEPWLPYYRPRLVHFLAEEAEARSLEFKDRQWYADGGIDLECGTRIVAIDPAARTARAADGRVFDWERLLIASGSLPFVPPAEGSQRPGVFTLRTLDDAVRIKASAASGGRAAVVGGGLLGLESAWSLRAAGLAVEVVETAPWLLPRQLDEEGGLHLQGLLEAGGLRFRLGDQAAAIEGAGADGPARALRLASGQAIEAGLVLFSVGVRPDVAWLAGTGLDIGRGVKVDDGMATNLPAIWAAGDICEHQGICTGLWMPAREQGRIAGTRMAGAEATYRPAEPPSLLKISGIDVFAYGRPPARGESVEAHTRTVDGGGFRRLVLNPDSTVRHLAVIADKDGIAAARKLLAGSIPAGDFLKT